jgi:2-keto-4-pentenoate hydratase/2-oxohepta-3-ene-1,7-dioic acid hydratase in catechol pathway
MRIASFVHNQRATYGVDRGDGRLADVGAVLGGRYPDVLEVLRAGAISDIEVAFTRAPIVEHSAVIMLPPVPNAPRIFCIGINYASHRDETGRAESAHPTVFVRFASSIVGAGQPLECPAASEMFDYEGELAFIIGRRGRRIRRQDALEHVAGYSCFNDGSVRDWQRHTSQFTPGKNFDRSGACGPWLVTADEVPDPATLELRTRLNGKEMQHSSTDLLIFDVPALVEYLSAFTELQPGDVVATGTPGGVGAARTPPTFMNPGDTIEVDITGVGTLRNPVTSEPAS